MNAASLIDQITSMMDTVVFQAFRIVLAVCAILYLYFLPFTVAYARRHNCAKTVFLMNLLLGWTGLGWIILLVWAFAGKKKHYEQNRKDAGTSDIVQEKFKELAELAENSIPMVNL